MAACGSLLSSWSLLILSCAVHPIRPFFDAASTLSRAKIRCYPQSTCADYRGLASFGSWVAEDTIVFRKRLGAAQLIYAEPNWICDAKLYQQYRKQLTLPEESRWAACVSWIGQVGANAGGQRGAELCSRYTFTSQGSEAISSRLHAAAKANNVPILRANAITMGACNSTVCVRKSNRLSSPISPRWGGHMQAMISSLGHAQRPCSNSTILLSIHLARSMRGTTHSWFHGKSRPCAHCFIDVSMRLVEHLTFYSTDSGFSHSTGPHSTWFDGYLEMGWRISQEVVRARPRLPLMPTAHAVSHSQRAPTTAKTVSEPAHRCAGWRG